jgi:hypothetical protein
MKCTICKKEYSKECDYMQGRCPHHPPSVDKAVVNKWKERILHLFRWPRR